MGFKNFVQQETFKNIKNINKGIETVSSITNCVNLKEQAQESFCKKQNVAKQSELKQDLKQIRSLGQINVKFKHKFNYKK